MWKLRYKQGGRLQAFGERVKFSHRMMASPLLQDFERTVLQYHSAKDHELENCTNTLIILRDKNACTCYTRNAPTTTRAQAQIRPCNPHAPPKQRHHSLPNVCAPASLLPPTSLPNAPQRLSGLCPSLPHHGASPLPVCLLPKSDAPAARPAAQP